MNDDARGHGSTYAALVSDLDDRPVYGLDGSRRDACDACGRTATRRIDDLPSGGPGPDRVAVACDEHAESIAIEITTAPRAQR